MAAGDFIGYPAPSVAHLLRNPGPRGPRLSDQAARTATTTSSTFETRQAHGAQRQADRHQDIEMGTVPKSQQKGPDLKIRAARRLARHQREAAAYHVGDPIHELRRDAPVVQPDVAEEKEREAQIRGVSKPQVVAVNDGRAASSVRTRTSRRRKPLRPSATARQKQMAHRLWFQEREQQHQQEHTRIRRGKDPDVAFEFCGDVHVAGLYETHQPLIRSFE